jgi:hypothetical protein
MKTLGFAAAIVAMAAALHAEEPPLALDESTVSGPRDATALIWWREPALYESECERLLLEPYLPQRYDMAAAVYAACLVTEAEQSRQRALRELTRPNPPGRH